MRTEFFRLETIRKHRNSPEYLVIVDNSTYHRLHSPTRPAGETCDMGFIDRHVARLRSSRYYGAFSKAAVTMLFTRFRRALVPEPGRKEARAPRRAHRRRWYPSLPIRVPHQDWRLPVSKIRPCAPWSRCRVRR